MNMMKMMKETARWSILIPLALPPAAARAGEVHTRDTAGTWTPAGNGMHGAIPNDSGYSFYLSPDAVTLGGPVTVTARVRFINHVDYGGVGVALMDPGATNATQKHLRIELSERQDTLGVGGWLEQKETHYPGPSRQLERDIKPGEWYELRLKVDGTHVTGALDGVEMVSADIPEVARLPRTLRIAPFIIEADAEIVVTGGGAPAAPPPSASAAGVRVSVEPYGHDETDGSDVGWNSRGLRPSLDDDPARRGQPNAAWDGSFEVRPGEICLRIANLRAPYPPDHTLAIGYLVTLEGAAFAGGQRVKTIVLTRFSGSPETPNHERCEAIH